METGGGKQEGARFCGRALVVDDTTTNQILMKSLLGKLGLEVTLAGDGYEAVQKAVNGVFDVILMDIQMPNMDGYQATQALREQGRTIPIIALTAHTSDEDESKCFAAGCDDYLSKPIDARRLMEKLGKYLSSGNPPVVSCTSPEPPANVGNCRSLGGPSAQED